jgi:hypothetical protein
LHACFFLAGPIKRATVKEKLPLETIKDPDHNLEKLKT